MKDMLIEIKDINVLPNGSFRNQFTVFLEMLKYRKI